jgi:hypothetical protein
MASHVVEGGTIQLEGVYYADEVDLSEVENFTCLANDEWMEQVDGGAVYRLDIRHENGRECTDYRTQRFTRGDRKELSEHVLLWGWDGDRKSPTLTPSYGVYGMGELKDAEWLVHVFLRDGEIDPCNDMVLEVA